MDSEKQERFVFRDIQAKEAGEAVRIEQLCFPPNEACKKEHMEERISRVPELFLVAYDKKAGRLAGFLNGIATDEEVFRDEFFTDSSLHVPGGSQVMLVGLDVHPDYRRQGLARALVTEYVRRERARGRRKLILTCHEEKIAMYEKMGFRSEGRSASVWGGEVWYEMSLAVSGK